MSLKNETPLCVFGIYSHANPGAAIVPHSIYGKQLPNNLAGKRQLLLLSSQPATPSICGGKSLTSGVLLWHNGLRNQLQQLWLLWRGLGSVSGLCSGLEGLALAQLQYRSQPWLRFHSVPGPGTSIYQGCSSFKKKSDFIFLFS